MWRGRSNAEMGRMKAVRRTASPLGLISSSESAVDVATKLSPTVSACEYSPEARSLPSPSGDGVDAASLSLNGHETPSSDSNSVPAPLEASRWRFPGGKRRCEIDCSCQKCHYSTLSQVVDQQSSWKCYASRCSCKKCHRRKRSKSTSAAVRKGRRSSCVSEVSPSSSSLPDVDGLWPSGRSWGSGRRRSASECGEESRRWAQQGRRNGMRSGGETKEVVYRCTPCAKDVYQWGNVRAHLMSMQHLESVKNYRRMVMGKGDCEREDSMARCSRGQKDQLLAGLDLVQVCGYGEEREPCIASCSSNCGEHAADAEGSVDAGVSIGSTQTEEDDGVTGDPQEGSAVSREEETLRGDGVASARQSPLLHNRTPHQTTPTVPAKQSTFIRIDYVKKKPARESTKPSAQYECARINGSGYNCAVADVDQLPLPYVNLGHRCDFTDLQRVCRSASRQTVSVTEQPAKKMIRRDYVRKPSQSSTPSPLVPPVGDAAEEGSDKDGQSHPPSSEADESEGALEEPLYLSESGDEDSDEAQGESMRNKQVVVLDSARFLNRLVRKLNDGGLSCQSCGCKMDSNSVVSQLYNLKPHSPGGDGGESSGECMDSEECGEEGEGEGRMVEDEGGRGEARGKDTTRRRRVVKRPVYLDDYETARVLRLAAADGKRVRMCGGRRDPASMLLMTNCVL
ncbi:uncharacterized protein LOC124170323 isoform X2 [Ischnura elegans]|uniref:uncharacterized protein LOC124170323 isoform X2 n=1 Tax=Ischnura elegans TaxID=197161 RepID=UPI001ED88860|nr:uncharacterized protein LOC124170323 isoform X2 [Ischnura elegans]